MAIVSIASLKAKWITGYKPTQADYVDLFDTLTNLNTIIGASGVVPDGAGIGNEAGTSQIVFNGSQVSLTGLIRLLNFAGTGNKAVTVDNDGDIVLKEGIQVIKATVPYTDFQPNATSSGQFQIGTLPAGSVPLNYKIKINEQFAAAGFVGFYGVTTGRCNEDLSEVIDFTPQANITIAPGDAKGEFGSCANTTGIPNQVEPSALYSYLSIGDDTETVTMNDLTAGSLDIWIWYIVGT